MSSHLCDAARPRPVPAALRTWPPAIKGVLPGLRIRVLTTEGAHQTWIPRTADDTPGLAGLNVVRPRAGAPRALHVDPRPGTGVDWHLSGQPAQHPDPRNRQASHEAVSST